MYSFDRNSFKFLFYLKFQLWFLKKSAALSFSDFLAILGKTKDGIRILQEIRSKLAEVSCPKKSWKIQWSAAFTSRIVLTLLNCRGRCMGFSHFSSRMWPDSQIIPEFLLTIYDQNSGHKNNWLQLLCVQYWDIFFFFFWKLYTPIIMDLSVTVHMVIQFWITDLHN